MCSNCYFLMNKDTPICKFMVGSANKNVGYIGLGVEVLETYINIPILKNLYDWMQNRLSPLGRRNITMLMKYANISSEYELVKVTKLVSFTDCFWVKALNDNITWNEISPYRNRLSRVIANIALLNDYRGGYLRSPSPEPATGGSFNKCWQRINGEIVLIKSSGDKWSESSGNEGFSEVLVCQLERALKFKSFVEYTCQTDNYITGRDTALYTLTKCKLFTTENTGYLPICDTTLDGQTTSRIYAAYKQLGSWSAEVFREMLLLDALTLNIDRHTGNFGFLFDTSTLKIKRIAPIFDNNLALCYNIPVSERDTDGDRVKRNTEELLRDINRLRPKTFNCSFIEQGRSVLKLDDKEHGTLRKRLSEIRDFQFIKDKQLKYLSDERLEFLNSLIKYQIEQILK